MHVMSVTHIIGAKVSGQHFALDYLGSASKINSILGYLLALFFSAWRFTLNLSPYREPRGFRLPRHVADI